MSSISVALTYFTLRKADTSTYGVTSASVKSCMRKIHVRKKSQIGQLQYAIIEYNEPNACQLSLSKTLLAGHDGRAYGQMSGHVRVLCSKGPKVDCNNKLCTYSFVLTLRHKALLLPGSLDLVRIKSNFDYIIIASCVGGVVLKLEHHQKKILYPSLPYTFCILSARI